MVPADVRSLTITGSVFDGFGRAFEYAGLRWLHEVHMIDCHFDPDTGWGWQNVRRFCSALRQSQHLESLSIVGPGLEPHEYASMLRRIQRLHRLRRLNLSLSPRLFLNRVVLQALVDLLLRLNLDHLTLHHCGITSRVADVINAVRGSTIVDMTNNPIHWHPAILKRPRIASTLK